MTQLIITEKPSQSKKIAEALADTKPTPQKVGKVTYFELTHKGKEILVGCAVGHLFNLKDTSKGWNYPTFEYTWLPSYEISKASDYTKAYVNVLKKLAKRSDEFVVACDYDLEGSLIGYNVLRFIANKKDGKRMKFSTLTKDELIESYAKASKHLDFPLIESGETRHIVDWIYGINVSRALTLSIKNATQRFKIMSSGRVQGPTLKLLAVREKEIKKFKPKPYWELNLINDVEASHKNGKFWKEAQVKKIHDKIKKEKSGIISKITKKEFFQAPPNPFDLTSLQLESYKLFRISPKQTLDVAQQLYTKAYISYPRTSSNQLPESLNYKKILKELSKQPDYKELVKLLLAKSTLTPNNGKKQDPAHPAIHPTGEIPKSLTDSQKKVYDLIVKRTLASFGEQAKRETLHLEIDVKKEIFIATGTTTLEKGWHIFYDPYVKQKEIELPKLDEGDKIKIKKISLDKKETQPPRRYTPASVIKELEKENLGTKATRAAILESLYARNYIVEQSIEVTTLGLETVDTLEKYCPEILDSNFTKNLESNMELIREEKYSKEKAIDEAKVDLTKILKKFRKHEMEIGKALEKANTKTMDIASIVGECEKCGKNLRVLYTKKFKSYFVACSGYPKCRNTYSLPQGLPKPAGNKCKECNFPTVKIIRKGKRPFDYCINKECPIKKEWVEKMEKESKESAKNKDSVETKEPTKSEKPTKAKKSAKTKKPTKAKKTTKTKKTTKK
jgi:DNA topoisomerase I